MHVCLQGNLPLHTIKHRNQHVPLKKLQEDGQKGGEMSLLDEKVIG
jgi:hypothetical protein